MTMAGLTPGSLSPSPHPPGDITTGGLELSAEPKSGKKPGPDARLGPAGSLPDSGCSPFCGGRHAGQLLTGLGVPQSREGSDATWREQKSSQLTAHLPTVCPTTAPMRPGTTQFRPTRPGERKEERQRAQGQMSELPFPRVPLITLVRKQKRVQTFAQCLESL